MNEDDQDSLGLGARMPIGDLNRLQRRLRYVEAALVQMLREERRLREWFTAPELVAMGLPGIPRTASGLTRHARERRWESRITRRDGSAETRMFHFASLPPAAFEALIDLVMRTPALDAAHDAAGAVPAVQARQPRPAKQTPRAASAATPQWLLPLMRLLRVDGVPLAQAMERLPADPVSGERPAMRDVVYELQRIGMLGT